MTLDLDAARRLHERATYDPEHCATCTGDTWPCATATALGATGRSEWANTPPGPAAGAVCGAVAYGDPDAPCIELPGHGSQHRDRNGDTWRQCATHPDCAKPCAYDGTHWNGRPDHITIDGTPITPETTP